MDSEQKFLITCWGTVVAVLMTLIVCCTFNAYDRRDKWDRAVTNGADPMVARCAVYGADTNAETAICTILAQGRK